MLGLLASPSLGGRGKAAGGDGGWRPDVREGRVAEGRVAEDWAVRNAFLPALSSQTHPPQPPVVSSVWGFALWQFQGAGRLRGHVNISHASLRTHGPLQIGLDLPAGVPTTSAWG